MSVAVIVYGGWGWRSDYLAGKRRVFASRHPGVLELQVRTLRRAERSLPPSPTGTADPWCATVYLRGNCAREAEARLWLRLAICRPLQIVSQSNAIRRTGDVPRGNSRLGNH